MHKIPNESKAGGDGEGVDMFLTSYLPVKSGIFNIYIYGVIYDATQFIPALEVLNSASENDIIVVHLSTPGGSTDATDTFISAMRECDSRIIVKATGGVHSAGSMILLNADEFVLSENFNCLIHNGSLGSGGKYSEWVTETKHKARYMERLMRSTYEGFLSNKEIDELLEGKDFWLDAEEFIKRHEARNEFLRKKMEKWDDPVVDELIAGLDAKKTKPRKKKQPEAA